MKWDEYYNYMIINQYEIPRRLEYIAESFGRELTYNQICDLYALSVKEILIIYNKTCILDLPFGKGFVLARKKWVSKMAEAIKILHEGKENV